MRHDIALPTTIAYAGGIALAISMVAPLTGCADGDKPDNLTQASPITTTTDMPLHESDGSGRGLDESFTSFTPSGDEEGRPDDNGVVHSDGTGDGEKQATDGQDGGRDGGEKAGDEASQGDQNGNPASLTDATLSSVVTSTIMYDSFRHGPLPADKVRYIVLHDTESGTDSASAIANSWGGGHIASHFIVDKQGNIIQCVPIDQIAHHAGNADYGSNDRYGIWAERDDEVGRAGEGDYAMNAWSVGIEIVHEHYEGAYTEAQLDAVDRLVTAIDDAVGHRPDIIDHKAWAGSRKQDVSDDFPLSAYQRSRRHDG